MLIYRVKNKENNKVYIGQTIRSICERWNGHCSSAKRGANNLFHNAISKYGKDAFIVEELAKADNQDQLDQLEKFYIEINNSLHPNGYNLKTGGSNGVIYSDESKEKMSKAKIGKIASETTKQKMSKSHKKRWENDDGTLSKDRSKMVKKAWSDSAYRKKMSKIRKEYWSDEDNRKKASKRTQDMISDPDYIKKISDGVKAAHKRLEVKEKMKKHYEKQQKKVKDSNGKVYNSIKEAASALNIMPSNIVKVLKGVYKKTKGLTFEYVTDSKLTNKQLDEIYQNKRSNPDPYQQVVYIVSGIAGSGKSWICEQLKNDERFHYVSYDNNRKKTHADLISSAPDDKIVLYDLNINTSTFIRRNCENFNIRFVTVLGDFLQVKQQLKDRGGKITKGTYSRWKVMKRRSKTYGEFEGSSYEVLKYLKGLLP